MKQIEWYNALQLAALFNILGLIRTDEIAATGSMVLSGVFYLISVVLSISPMSSQND